MFTIHNSGVYFNINAGDGEGNQKIAGISELKESEEKKTNEYINTWKYRIYRKKTFWNI